MVDGAASEITRAVDAARLAAAATESGVDAGATGEAWTVTSWLRGLNTVQIVADALLQPVRAIRGRNRRVELSFVESDV